VNLELNSKGTKTQLIQRLIEYYYSSSSTDECVEKEERKEAEKHMSTAVVCGDVECDYRKRLMKELTVKYFRSQLEMLGLKEAMKGKNKMELCEMLLEKGWIWIHEGMQDEMNAMTLDQIQNQIVLRGLNGESQNGVMNKKSTKSRKRENQSENQDSIKQKLIQTLLENTR